MSIVLLDEILPGYSSGDSILKLIGILILCVLIIVACYFTTRFVGRRQMGGQGLNNFKPIDTFRIDQNRYLQIIEIAGRYMLISVTKENINYLCDLDPNEVKERENSGSPVNFKDIFTRVLSKHDDDKQEKQ